MMTYAQFGKGGCCLYIYMCVGVCLFCVVCLCVGVRNKPFYFVYVDSSHEQQQTNKQTHTHTTKTSTETMTSHWTDSPRKS